MATPSPVPPSIADPAVPPPKAKFRPTGGKGKKRPRPKAKEASSSEDESEEENAPNLQIAANVISALNFGQSQPSRPSTAPRLGRPPKKAAAPSSTSSTPPVAVPPPIPANGRVQRASKVNATLRMTDAVRRDVSPPPSPPTPKQSKAVPLPTIVEPPPPTLAQTKAAELAAPALHKNPVIAYRSLPRAMPLDMESVKTKGPRIPPPRTEPRAFGLTEAPTFYPSKEEFKNPMEYIRWCGDEGGAKDFGICKIVPPEGWQPPFVMNTETFRFKTRLMRINSMEAKSRAKINFLEQLFIYHQQQGNADISTPLVDHREVDLWLLRKEVTQVGGFNEVNRRKIWTDISKKIGYSSVFSQQIKFIYQTLIFPFDEFALRARSALIASPLTPLPASPGGMRPNVSAASTSNAAAGRLSAAHLGGSTSSSSLLDPGFNAVASSSRSPLGRPPSNRGRGDGNGIKRTLNFEDADSSLSEQESEGEEGKKKEETKRRRIPERQAAKDATAKAAKLKPSLPVAPQDAPKGDLCEVCWKGNAATKILLCDACDAGFHIYCLDPPLASVPKNESWYCSACLFGTGNEYGFDEGEEHSITSFQKRDTAFREHWFDTHPVASEKKAAVDAMDLGPNGFSQQIGKKIVSEHDIETEFWRLVESEEETVEVEYGADVHSTIHGSAAPTYETHPLDPYSIDQWNLNNMPILPGSVLRYIKSNISGMTVPWIYIGFIFSCFAWHNEDHYTSSVNYMHWGETKTWYGIPGDDAGKFEAAIKAEAPDLFEQQPALLFQLITLMNPGRVQKAGVRVFAVDQRANEFVITFPKAYHSGFNHGLNYNEAVNFARFDWLKFGRECVENYRGYAKAPVFDHNELLISIAEHSHTIDTSLWLQEPLGEMIINEMASRDRLRAQLSTEEVPLREIVEEVDRPEDEYQCSVCKAFSYLSQVICACTSSVACLEHATELCACPSSSLTLRNRFSKDSLLEIQDTIISRSAIPSLWTARFHRVLSDQPGRPCLKALRSLVADAERINHPLPDFESLKEFVERCNDLMAHAAVLLSKRKGRKYVPKAKPKLNGDANMEDSEEEKPFPRTVEAVETLIAQIGKLGFDAPEVASLEALVVQAREFKEEVAKVLPIPDEEQSLKDCENLLSVGSLLNLDSPELEQLEKTVQRLRWNRDLGQVEDSVLEVKQIDEYLRTAKESGVSDTHPFVIELEKKQVLGHAWRDEAKSALGGQSITIVTLDRLLERAEESPIDLEILLRVKNLRNKAVEWEKQAKEMLASTEPGFERKPIPIADVRKYVKKIEAKGGCLAVIPELEILRKEVAHHDSWNAGLHKLLPSSKNKLKDLEEILNNVRFRTYPDDDVPSVEIKAPPTIPGASADDSQSDAGGEGGESSEATLAGPLQPFSCVCRQPEEHPMLKCKTCAATYHGECVEVSARSVKVFKRYQCVVCDPKKLDAPRNIEPKLSEFTTLIQAHNIAWKFPPPEHILVIKIVHKSIRFLEVVSGHLQPTRRSGPVDEVEIGLLRHYLRKIDQLAIDLEVLSAEGDVLDVRNTLLQALEIVSRSKIKTGEKKRTRERKPRWEIEKEKKKGSRAEGQVYCVCNTPPPDADVVVTCLNPKCGQKFHASCVFCPPNIPRETGMIKCPLCCLKTGQRYLFADVRLQMQEHVGSQNFVDIKATLHGLDRLVTVTLLPIQQPGIIFVANKFVQGVKADPEPEGEGAAATIEQPKKKKPRVSKALPPSANAPAPAYDHAAYQAHYPKSVASGSGSTSHIDDQRARAVEQALWDIKDEIRKEDPHLSEAQVDMIARSSAAPVLEGDGQAAGLDDAYLPSPDETLLPIPKPLSFEPPPPPSELIKDPSGV